MTSWYKDLRDAYVIHHPNWPQPAPRGEHGLVEMSRVEYLRVDEYDASTPTSPSQGRVYRRLHKMDGVPFSPCLYIVYDDPLDPTGQYHHPYLVLLR